MGVCQCFNIVEATTETALEGGSRKGFSFFVVHPFQPMYFEAFNFKLQETISFVFTSILISNEKIDIKLNFDASFRRNEKH